MKKSLATFINDSLNNVRSYKFLALSLVFTIFATGCERADRIAADITTALNDEQTHYQSLQAVLTANGRGERNVTLLELWTQSNIRVRERLDALENRFRQHPEERARVEPHYYDQLRIRLEAVLTHGNLPLIMLTPRWQNDQAQALLSQVNAARITLSQRYEFLYNRPAPQLPNPAPVQIIIDTRLYDTKSDCINAISLYGLARGDMTCASLAQQVCGHQMLLTSCLSPRLLLAAANQSNCTDVTCVDGPSGGSQTCSRQTASWISGLSTCHARPDQPIEGPNHYR